ncbi:hypothetical protein HDU67_001088 [Dinochytrium kinnereticum]|nr:hypothetical protein HDU67_001088 [Dinochytrium kinnereticum]
MKESPSEPQVKKKSRKTRRKPSNIMEEFGTRSKEDRLWLETHLWHAKRMHMITIWGFKIAEHPNEKGERATYRASQHQCVLNDVSYLRCFELKGRVEEIISCLKTVLDPTVTTLGKEAIILITLFTLKLIESDLQRFELIGPRSHAILQEVLKVLPTSPSEKLWEELKHLRSSSSLPAGVVIGLHAQDPRLRGACKAPTRVEHVPEEDMKRIHKLSVDWPVDVANSPLWDDSKRTEVIASRPSDKVINDLKSKLLVPGSDLQTSHPPVPVLLLQRQPYYTSADPRNTTFESGWDLIVPSKFAINFWRALVYAGARAAGLRERRRIYFEAGVPCFPYDFPETEAYQSWAAVVGEEEREKWSRRPPAKRVSYAKLGIADPFMSPFYKLVQGRKESEDSMEVEKESKEEDAAVNEEVVEEKESADALDETELELLPLPKLGLNPFKPATVLSSTALIRLLRIKLPSVVSLQSLNDLALSLVKEKTCSPIFDFDRSLLRVRFSLLVKGASFDRGIIFSPAEEDLGFWTDVVAGKEGVNGETKLDKFPSNDRIIGYVTTGGFTYTEGHSTALGCCTVAGLQKCFYMSSSKSKGGVRNMVLIRSTTGRVCWPASFEIIS